MTIYVVEVPLKALIVFVHRVSERTRLARANDRLMSRK
jgi:hypothetical protein